MEHGLNLIIFSANLRNKFHENGAIISDKVIVKSICTFAISHFSPSFFNRPEAEFFNVIGHRFSTLLFTVASTNGFNLPPPSQPEQKWLKNGL